MISPNKNGVKNAASQGKYCSIADTAIPSAATAKAINDRDIVTPSGTGPSTSPAAKATANHTAVRIAQLAAAPKVDGEHSHRKVEAVTTIFQRLIQQTNQHALARWYQATGLPD
jgi:hypothetical protein